MSEDRKLIFQISSVSVKDVIIMAEKLLELEEYHNTVEDIQVPLNNKGAIDVAERVMRKWVWK